MASKNSGPGGMRILWLPGRKKQHRKGEYKPTKTYTANYGSTPQSNRNEMWTMGGARGHKDLMTAEIPSDLAVSTTSHAATIVTDSIGLAAAAGGVVATGQNQSVQPLNEVISVDCEDKPKTVIEDLSNEHEHSNNNSHLNNKPNCYENSSTLALRDRNNRKHNSGAISDDLDSIEALDDVHSTNTNQLDPDFDSLDGASLSNNNASMNKLRKRSRMKKKNGKSYDGDDATTIDYDDENKSETNEKLVTCLYYSMMCCECSIS